jgi:hypothetical protein
MQVSTMIDYVVNGDLRQTILSDIGTKDSRNDVQQKNLDTIVGFVNQASNELHKRFPIKIGIDDAIIYTPSTPDDYIVLPDSALELIKITAADITAVPRGELTAGGVVVPTDDYDIEYRYIINEYEGIYAKTIAINSYMILGKIPTTGITVQFHYRSAPDLLRYSSVLPMPAMYHEALLNYVAYRGYSTIPSITPIGDTGLNYKKKFEDSCLRIEQNTDTLYEWANPKRLTQKGFV